MVIEEEEEEEENEEVEEVEAFSPVEIGRGESVHSITVWDERRLSQGADAADDDVLISQGTAR